jgi:ribonucleoside-diphosphate reductase alpha chain
MYIVKSNNQKQQFLPNKLLKRIKDQSKGLNVDEVKVFQECVSGIVDGMTSKEVDNLIAVTSANLIIEDYDYSYLAARIIISRHGKTIGVEPVDSDYLFDFLGITAFLHKYSARDEKGNPIELPHMMYKRVAEHLFKDEGEEEIKKQYDYIRYHKISLATPQLMNFGTERQSGISCNITTLENDTTEGILKTLDDISLSSREGAGIGLHIHALRSKESLVSSFKGFAGGVVRFADMVQSHMRFFKQGNRSGSAALYLGVWHRDIEDFLELRLPTGDEKMRARDVFTAVCIPDLFMEKLNNGEEDWYLFCPNEVKKAGFKALHDTWGEEFNSLYYQLVEAGLGRKTSIKEIWNMITRSLVESGLPYVFFWDNANKQNMQDNISVVRGFNLCLEYAGVSNPNYTSQCNLGLIPLHNIEKNDFTEIEQRVRQLVRSLNKAIKVTVWSNDSAKNAGEDQRTIGIGIAGLSDYLQKNSIPYVSEEAKEFNREIMRVIYETAVDESSKLVKKYGVYPAWEGSKYQKQGKKVANSLFVCLMPSASTSTLLSVTESFEAPHSNIFVRKVDSGEFTIVNKYLINDLKKLNLWNNEIKLNIIANQGSIQQIEEIPDNIKEVYKTIWEIKMKDYIDIAAIRQENIDQGQSMNLYFSNPTTGKISGALNHGWKLGLPSGSYYTKTKSALPPPVRLSVDTKPKDSLFDCFGCSS